MKDSTLFQDDSSHHFPKIVAGVCVMEKKVGLLSMHSLLSIYCSMWNDVKRAVHANLNALPEWQHANDIWIDSTRLPSPFNSSAWSW